VFVSLRAAGRDPPRGHDTPLPPCKVRSRGVDPVAAEPPSMSTYRCPVSACSGWVDFIEGDDRPFWGCGECGSLWYQKVNLLKEIEAITRLFPYRNECYSQVGGEWLPAAHSDDYERRVEEEPQNQSDDFVRG
jgi:hypothetical protein